MITKKTALALLMGSVFSVSLVAEESQLDNDSYDTSYIDITIDGGNNPGDGGSILIANLEAIPLGDFGSALDGNDIKGQSNFCVYRTGAGDSAIKYKLVPANEKLAADDGTGFNLETTGGEKLKYTATHFSQIGQAGVSTEFTYNGTKMIVDSSKNGTLTGDHDGGYGCSGDNASLEVSVAFEDALAAVAGKYSSTLTLTVEPM